ncbi:HNH endonuclease [Roseobacter phage RD-1410W1-01]|uniref:Metallopeptidase domain containing protein n=1 Tax=Roseobacter phage RD-1410W1-01 TaxID=1815984 RepID=A0A191VYG7_9CAUD|nr:HNH endonuclease [Roseobacter phage RD-1410W1-01]ANJ20762.1 metallopeptidase domain containing protein [Roseobacter phage RD-1410W1-01]
MSSQPMTNPSSQVAGPVGMNTNNGSASLQSADATFRSIVEDMLLTDNRFVGLTSYVLQIKFWWSEAIDTACAGAGFIFFNPKFWDKLDAERRKTVVAHEIWHLILNHLDRGEGLDPESYNIAGDYVINWHLKEDGFCVDNPFGDIDILLNGKYAGMSTEAVYAKVHKQRKQDPKSHAAPHGTPTADQIEDLIKEALNGTGKDLGQQKKQNDQARDEAVQQAKAGNGDGSTDRILASEGFKVFIQEKTYEEIFEQWLLDPLSGGKRTYLRPSRRQIAGGLRLKGKFQKRGKHNRLTHLVYALDVSGSITAKQAQQFLRSAKTLKEKLNPVLMTVILWDTKIKFEKVFKEDETLDNIRVTAGGGTNLTPVYKRLKQLNPEAAVIFTDLEVTIPPKPSWETIWFVPNLGIGDYWLQKVNYGEVYLVPEK